MARIRISPPEHFSFSTNIAVRITDLNYGNHVGNDAVLSMLHEARMQFLGKWGYTEMNFAGAGLIMSDVAIEFRRELFYGDIAEVSVQVSEFSSAGFDIYYKIEISRDGKKVLAVIAKTGMVCYDYARKKIVHLPTEALNNLR